MLLIRGMFEEERMLTNWRINQIHWTLDKTMLDANTVTLAVSFNDTELSKILQYDTEKQRNDEKIIVGATTFLHNITVINPINLKGAVDSGHMTVLEILVIGDGEYSFESPALQLMKDCAFKYLYITTFMCFTLQPSHTEDLVKLINRYQDTLNQLLLIFEKADTTAFSKIYEEVEHWIMNTHITPQKIYLTAKYDINNKPCESLPEYNDMQERLQFLIKCKHYSKLFKTTIEKQEREELCAEIIRYNPEFTRNFSKYPPSQIKKFMGDYHIYNTFLGYYIDHSTTLNDMSEHCYKETKKHLPHDTKERIVKYSGGIGVIIGIDNALENNNSTTDQQDTVINQAEVMNIAIIFLYLILII